MAVEHDTQVRRTSGGHDGQPSGPHSSPYSGPDPLLSPGGRDPGDPVQREPWRRPWRRWVWLRLLLLGLSSGGMIAAIVLWVHGHGWMGLRVLAGDMLVLLALLLLL